MKHTLDEWYRIKFSHYYMKFDNKGNFQEGKGLIPYGVVGQVTKVVKNSITKRRKTDMYVEALYYEDCLKRVTAITQGQYNRENGWL